MELLERNFSQSDLRLTLDLICHIKCEKETIESG